MRNFKNYFTILGERTDTISTNMIINDLRDMLPDNTMIYILPIDGDWQNFRIEGYITGSNTYDRISQDIQKIIKKYEKNSDIKKLKLL